MPPDAAADPPRAWRAKAKRHHYIPELIQRQFAGPDLHLWSFDKRHADWGLKRKPIALLFREWDLYTFVGVDGSRDRSSETLLSAIESRAGPILDRIVSEARAGRRYGLADSERRPLVAFLIAQLRRSPDFFASVAPAEQVEADVARLFGEWEEQYGPATDEQRAEFASGRMAKQTRHNLLAQNAPQPLARSTAVMLSRGLSVGVVREQNRNFILGSNPFARFLGLASRRNGLGDPGAEAWLPIAPDVALCSFGGRSDERLFVLPGTVVRTINSVIDVHSTVIASASRDLVASFARRALRAASRSR